MRANPSLNRTAYGPPVSSVPVLVLINKSETLVLVSQGDELAGGKPEVAELLLGEAGFPLEPEDDLVHSSPTLRSKIIQAVVATLPLARALTNSFAAASTGVPSNSAWEAARRRARRLRRQAGSATARVQRGHDRSRSRL